MKLIQTAYALVAQLDRVTGYEPVGQGFESLPARQRKDEAFGFRLFGFYSKISGLEPLTHFLGGFEK